MFSTPSFVAAAAPPGRECLVPMQPRGAFLGIGTAAAAAGISPPCNMQLAPQLQRRPSATSIAGVVVPQDHQLQYSRSSAETFLAYGSAVATPASSVRPSAPLLGLVARVADRVVSPIAPAAPTAVVVTNSNAIASASSSAHDEYISPPSPARKTTEQQSASDDPTWKPYARRSESPRKSQIVSTTARAVKPVAATGGSSTPTAPPKALPSGCGRSSSTTNVRCDRAEASRRKALPRSSSGSALTSPRSQRYHALYNDHAIRNMKLNAKRQEKQRGVEEKLRQQREANRSGRPFDKDAFMDWYMDRRSRWQELEEHRSQQRSSARRAQQEEELVKCSFQPRSASPRRLGELPNHCVQGRALSPRRGSPPPAAKVDEAQRLVVEQALKLECLAALGAKEENAKKAVREEAMEGLEQAAEGTRRTLDVFLVSEEGRAYLAERGQSYVEMNDGMAMADAMREAQEDLVKATMAKLRTQAEANIRRRLELVVSRVLFDRLEALRDLIRLQRQAEALLTADRPPPILTCFDLDVVERLMQEQWYISARERTSCSRLDGTSSLSPEAAGEQATGGGSRNLQ